MKKSRPLSLLLFGSLALVATSLLHFQGIAQDAAAPAKPKANAKVDFMRDVKPLLEGACVQCHGPNEKELGGKYRIDSKEDAFAGGSSYKKEAIIPGDANNSPVYWMTNLHLYEPKSDECMPPKKPLNEEQQKVLFDWIQGGAEWPDDVFLEDKPRVNFENVRQILLKSGEFEGTEKEALMKEIDARIAMEKSPFKAADKEALAYWIEQGRDFPNGASLSKDGRDNHKFVEGIHAKVVNESKVTIEGDMADYENAIPETGVKYQMVAIKGGEFTMGSPPSDDSAAADEHPQHPVGIEPFWMGKFEVTWNQYQPFMITKTPRYKDGSPMSYPPDPSAPFIVTKPTTPYVEMSFGMGTDNYPAISMTQHAALKFCEWLSSQTGHYYRLPTEAEWEYACRAGTTTTFSHGDTEEGLEDFAVYDPTQTRVGYENIGTKKPNPWGLYDMHGNVLEWCLDQYIEDAYSRRDQKKVNLMPFEKPTKLYPRVVRGGSWYDPAKECRSAVRYSSHPNWKMTDPQLPKSIWYHTDASWLGFRIVRPLKTPPPKEMYEIWNLGIVDDYE